MLNLVPVFVLQDFMQILMVYVKNLNLNQFHAMMDNIMIQVKVVCHVLVDVPNAQVQQNVHNVQMALV